MAASEQRQTEWMLIISNTILYEANNDFICKQELVHENDSI